MSPSLAPETMEGRTDIFANQMQVIAKRGLFLSLIFSGLIIASIFIINLEGAVISSATVVPTGENKVVQHREGGVVEELLIKNGDKVTSGQPLIILNKKAAQADYNVISFRRIELGAKLARLKARLNNDETFSYTLPSKARFDKEALQIVATQTNLFHANREAMIAAKQQLNERIGSLSLEITALESQIQTTQEQSHLINKQLSDILPFVADQLVPKAREWDLRRTQVSVRSQLDALNVNKVRLQSSLTETHNQLNQLTVNYEQETLTLIEQTEIDLQSTNQTYNNLQEQLKRRIIKAPVSGKIHELEVFNQNGVIRPGETIMKIVPQDQGIILSAKVNPVDIDQIYIGQNARLRFDAFDVNKTPEIPGLVTHIGADLSIDEVTGLPFFSASINVNPEDMQALGTVEIISGMPVTAMMTTQSRSLFSYLTKPITDQSVKVFQ